MSTSPGARPLPPETYALGSPVAEFESPDNLRTGIIMAVIGLVLSCASLALYFTVGVPEIMAIVAPIALVLGLVIAAQGYSQRGNRVLLFKDALAEVKSKKVNIARWDDIVAVWQAITVTKMYGVVETGRTHLYTIQTQDNRRMTFGAYKGIETLGTTIQREVNNRLMPRYLEAYNSGGSVKFGTLTLSKSGLSNGKETIPWSEVQQVTINNGTITVRKQGKWLGWSSQTAAQTPNLFIFLTMIDQIVGVNKPRS